MTYRLYPIIGFLLFSHQLQIDSDEFADPILTLCQDDILSSIYNLGQERGEKAQMMPAFENRSSFAAHKKRAVQSG